MKGKSSVDEARINVSERARVDLREFANGLNTTYDAAVRFLLHLATQGDERPLYAGDRMRSQFDEWKREENGEVA